MALDITPEEKAVGQANFDRVAEGLTRNELTRRQFIKSLAVTGGVVVPVSTAAYFGYQSDKGLDKGPVKAALIGAGDEGGVLIGEHDPKFVQIVAVCDIRPSNQKRIFEDERTKNPRSPRRGLRHHYGANASTIKVFKGDYKQMLAADKDKKKEDQFEMVIIALPLHLHKQAAIDCMNAGKHVLCEKLMAWDIASCKEMIEVAEKNDVALAIGHQRHYSLLYAHAQELMASDMLGDVRHIRALWHRNNATPKLDKNGKPLEIRDKDGKLIADAIKDSWRPAIPEEDRKALGGRIKDLGYKSMEELCRWRLYKRTGGGLMAELGSHQLDACSIFLGKVHPLAVTGVGGKYFYTDDREVEDHVFCTFEFPGKHYDPKKGPRDNDIVVVTYSSISTNGFEKYGECVMGSRATMVVEEEQSIQLYSNTSRSTAVAVSTAGGKPVLESGGSTPGADRPAAVASGAAGAVSRGYREEMNHFAYVVRMWHEGSNKEDRPKLRCPGRVAMADAIIALTSNLAMQTHQRIEFKPEWFEASSPRTPEKDVLEKKNA
jgi:predicted dehydrogenase